jgi:S1-C subfamily serine protease
VLGKDESTDVALLRVDPEGLRLAPLALGSSKGVEVGDPAIAIGNPFGLERTLTTGVISAVKRTIQAPNSFEIDDVLQTDAPINPGNSGGPLIDATGKVIGINSQIATGGSGSNGSVRHRLRRPDRHRQADHPRPQAVRARGPRLPRARCADRRQGAEGHRARRPRSARAEGCARRPGRQGGHPRRGLTATLDNHPIQLGGDIITKVAGKDIRSDNDLQAAVADRKPGEKVKSPCARGKVKTGRRHARRAPRAPGQP